MYRAIAKKVFWEFDYIIMQILSDIMPLFFTPTSHHAIQSKRIAKFKAGGANKHCVRAATIRICMGKNVFVLEAKITNCISKN